MKKVIYAKLKKKKKMEACTLGYRMNRTKKVTGKKTKSSRNSSNYCTVSAIWP